MTSPETAGGRKVALAAVAGAHGIKGEVRLKLFAEGVGSLSRYPTLSVGGRALKLESIRDAGGKGAVARFAGIADRTAAEGLRGSLVEVDRDSLPPLEEGEYYHSDIIGLPCFDQAGEQVGTVSSVENFGAGDLLEVEKPDGRRSLIPLRSGIADYDGQKIILDPEFLA